VVVFPTVLAVVLLFDLLALRGDPGWPVRIVICVFGAGLSWRLFRLAAIGTSDGRLVVRNHWSDRTVQRDDIAAVSVSDLRGSSFRKSVGLTLRDGSALRLEVTEVLFSTRRLERQAAEVREWVSGRPRPFL
jgi:hypothetical protein